MKRNQTIIDRIEGLRTLMKKNDLSALIIPQADPHGSEYVADHWQLRRYFSGFTGSAGPLVVFRDSAYVIADSRYWLQAAEQLEGTGISVIEAGKPGAPSLEQLLLDKLGNVDSVGIDGNLISDNAFESLDDALYPKRIALVDTGDLAGSLWPDRPELPLDEVEIHELCYAGESAQSKIKALRQAMRKERVSAVFVADLAVIAWLLNIRSTDVACNPVVISYLYVSRDMAVLFVDERKLTDEVRAYLAYCGVTTAPYDAAAKFLSNLKGEILACDRGSLPHALASAYHGACYWNVDLGLNVAKAIRNDVQIAGTRAAMERDGAALVKGFKEIEERVMAGDKVSELDVDAILTARRSEQPLYKMLSFDTIAGYGPHGAIVHYEATPDTSVDLKPEGLLLVDSGASYLDGTTDITRTIALGTPTAEMMRDYTAVLQGNVALARAVFPVGTRGAQLDALARIPMWRFGGHYLHGTGHGVGHYLNVHEGPQSIRLQENPQPIEAGMLTSDEPGLYRAGKYGIRIENLLLAVPAFVDPDYGQFLKFETVTLYPFDRNLIDMSMLTSDEVAWIDEYHAEVFRRLKPYLSDDEVSWLGVKCAPLNV